MMIRLWHDGQELVRCDACGIEAIEVYSIDGRHDVPLRLCGICLMADVSWKSGWPRHSGQVVMEIELIPTCVDCGAKLEWHGNHPTSVDKYLACDRCLNFMYRYDRDGRLVVVGGLTSDF